MKFVCLVVELNDKKRKDLIMKEWVNINGELATKLRNQVMKRDGRV